MLIPSVYLIPCWRLQVTRSISPSTSRPTSSSTQSGQSSTAGRKLLSFSSLLAPHPNSLPSPFSASCHLCFSQASHPAPPPRRLCLDPRRARNFLAFSETLPGESPSRRVRHPHFRPRPLLARLPGDNGHSSLCSAWLRGLLLSEHDGSVPSS